MIEAVHRTFRVEVSPAEAWARLAQIERWPEWAPHITAATVSPAGALGPASTGALRIRGLGRTAFRMTVWEPGRRWTWVGAMPGATVTYEHGFAPAGEAATTLDWVVSLDGPLAFVIRPLFARIYGRNLDRAIPRLKAWIATA
jgi:carbon monoxide dehydrogenase subunit G